MVALRPALEAGEPWPLAERFGAEPEAHWGPREVLAHCAEMLPYWIGEIERILAGPEPAPYGRVQTDELRIAIIERDRSLPIRELLARIEDGAARYGRRLPELTAADIARRGLHPTLGGQTIEEVLERTVVGHMEGHLAQLRRPSPSAPEASSSTPGRALARGGRWTRTIEGSVSKGDVEAWPSSEPCPEVPRGQRRRAARL